MDENGQAADQDIIFNTNILKIYTGKGNLIIFTQFVYCVIIVRIMTPIISVTPMQKLIAMHSDGTLVELGVAAEASRVTDKVTRYMQTIGQLTLSSPTLSETERQTIDAEVHRLETLAVRIIEENPNLEHLSESATALIQLIAGALHIDSGIVLIRALTTKVDETQPLLKKDGAWTEWISSPESQGELPPGMRFYIRLVDQLDMLMQQPGSDLWHSVQAIHSKAKRGLLRFQIIQLGQWTNQFDGITLDYISRLSQEELLAVLPKIRTYVKTFIEILRQAIPPLAAPIQKADETVRSFIVPHIKASMERQKEQVKLGDLTAVKVYIALLEICEEAPSLFPLDIQHAKNTLTTLLSQKCTDIEVKRAIMAALGLQFDGLLFGTKEPIHPMQREWHIHFALMYDAYRQTSYPKTQSIITAAAIHYLAKAAPYPMELPTCTQVSKGNTSGSYHRLEAELSPGIHNEFLHTILPRYFARIPAVQFYLTQSAQIAPLLALRMRVITPTDITTATGCARFKQTIQQLMEMRASPKPIFDLTALLGATVYTEGDPARDRQFTADLQNTLRRIHGLISEAIRERASSTSAGVELERQLTDAGAILCARYRKNGIVFTFPIRDGGACNSIQEAISATGCRLGAVATRALIADSISLRSYWAESNRMARLAPRDAEPVQYAVLPPLKAEISPLHFKTPCDLLATTLFRRSMARFSRAQTPHVFGLGRGTLAVLCGFLQEISKRDWTQANEDPAVRLVLQSTMTRLLQHLATAENRIDDFMAFSQAIELVHAEMATLFLLIEHEPAPFSAVYHRNLIQANIVPASLHTSLETGLAPSFMSVMAELTVRVQPSDRPIRVAHNPYTYFESLLLFSGDTDHSKVRPVAEVLAETGYVDLYTAAFHPVLATTPPPSGLYAPPNVIGDVRKLLERSPVGHTLTVAIDSTIDRLYSKELTHFLKEFESDILAGRLTIVVCRSGQKYDMLGMDQYYGAPFFVISNQKGWRPLTNANLRTDPLSHKWFSLAHRYAERELDTYQKTIFDHTRYILDRIPTALKGKQAPFVAQIDRRLIPGFIQVVVAADDVSRLSGILTMKFSSAEREFSGRSSFGFNQSNMCIIGNTLRITPGTDPKDASLIVEALQEFASPPADG